MKKSFKPAEVCECGQKFVGNEKFCQRCGQARKHEKEEEPSVYEIWWDKSKYKLSTPEFHTVFWGTFLTFCITLYVFAYFTMNHVTKCIFLDMAITVFVCYAIFMNTFIRSGKYPAALISGIQLGAVVGTILGLYVYDTAAVFPEFYEHARKYSDVVSSEPSQAVADAGKLLFNSQTRVDHSKGVGYTREDGTVYCVAPIMDDSNQPRIEFWAAGLNCCSPAGDFKCDWSRDDTATAGIVVFDNNGWFAPARYPYYQKARAKAEAEWLLQSVSDPIFVRWVKSDNLNMLHDNYARKALLYTVMAFIVWFILSAAWAFATWTQKDEVLF